MKSDRTGLQNKRGEASNGLYFQREGIELVVPDTTEQDYIHSVYMTELVNGAYRDEVRERFVTFARDLQEKQGIDGLVLGGTELPLLMRDAEGLDIPMIDTGRLHVERAVAELFS